MKRGRRRVVLVSTPGLIQKATESTLATCTDAELVATAHGALSATALLAKTTPELLLIDATLPEKEVEALLRWVKENCPAVQCAVTTVTSRQRDLVLSWGADVSFQRSDLARGLREVLDCGIGSRDPASRSGNTQPG